MELKDLNWNFKNLEDVQKQVKDRQKYFLKNRSKVLWEIYYGESNEIKVPVIHIKFCDMRKAYSGFNELRKSKEGDFFANEYIKYFNRVEETPSIFTNPQDILNYVEKHKLPIIFYDNSIDEELSFAETKKYFRECDNSERIEFEALIKNIRSKTRNYKN